MIGLLNKMLNIMQCQCIVSDRSSGLSPYIFDIYFWSADHSLKELALINLKQFINLCIFWFWILISAANYQLYTHYQLYTYLTEIAVCNLLSTGCDFTR